MPVSFRLTKKCVLTLCLLALLGNSGCNIIGAIAGKLPKPDIEASYKGLQNQSVGVLVWVDPSTLLDWPSLQLDLANSIDAKLREAQKAGQEEFKGTSFPYQPRSFIKYQKEHPADAAMPILEVAPKLGVQRLIYVEVSNFTSRAEGTVTMYLGQMEASLKVIEIGNGVARIAEEENQIHVQFPPKAPKEGLFNKTDRTMYVGTLNEMSTQLAVRFFKHPDDTP